MKSGYQTLSVVINQERWKQQQFLVALFKFLQRFPKKRSLKQKWWRPSKRRPKPEYRFMPDA